MDKRVVNPLFPDRGEWWMPWAVRHASGVEMCKGQSFPGWSGRSRPHPDFDIVILRPTWVVNILTLGERMKNLKLIHGPTFTEDVVEFTNEATQGKFIQSVRKDK